MGNSTGTSRSPGILLNESCIVLKCPLYVPNNIEEELLRIYKIERSPLGCDLPKTLILHGPTGNGKTTYAYHFCKKVLNYNWIDVPAVHFVADFVTVREAFETAKSNRPCVMFLDNLDGIRGCPGPIYALKKAIDDVEGLSGVFVIAKTNNLDWIDESLQRRFFYKILVTNPEHKDRVEIFKRFFLSRKIDPILTKKKRFQ
eukprot:Tbor_TRINITY_DN5787_c0_g2::TRINITY_DN5787_c0_g2_i1::g.20856::m.20856